MVVWIDPHHETQRFKRFAKHRLRQTVARLMVNLGEKTPLAFVCGGTVPSALQGAKNGSANSPEQPAKASDLPCGLLWIMVNYEITAILDKPRTLTQYFLHVLHMMERSVYCHNVGKLGLQRQIVRVRQQRSVAQVFGELEASLRHVDADQGGRRTAKVSKQVPRAAADIDDHLSVPDAGRGVPALAQLRIAVHVI